MSFYKIDLQEDAWLDEVFQSRNKAYGAFQIRKSYSQNSLYGLSLALASFTLLLCLPLFLHAMKGENAKNPIGEVIKLTKILPPEVIKPPLEMKEVLPKPTKPTLKFLPPVITPDNKVDPKQNPPSIQDITGKNIGSKTTTGTDSASLEIPDEPNKGTGEVSPKESPIEISPEIPAQYPGGYEALSSDVSQFLKNHYPKEALENGVSGKVILNFVVEKDGSIDLIQVLRGKDLGAGLPEVAVKAVEHLKKFHPGKQNGQPVRQYFSFPITFETQNNE